MNRHPFLLAAGVALCAMVSTRVAAQDLNESQVPAAVLASMKKAFPNATDVDWELKGTQYKVDFDLGTPSRDHDVWYDAAGTALKHEEDIPATELPAAVQAAIQKDFPGHRVDDADKVVEGNVTTYKVELKTSGQDWKVVFDANGAVLSKKED